MIESILPIIVLCSSLVTGVVIFFIGEEFVRSRSTLNMFGATLKVASVGYMIWGTLERDMLFEFRFSIALGFDFLLRADELSLLFVALSAVLWWVTTVYAIGYLEGTPNRSRFFGFFSLCVTASTGIALAGNLITFFIFYEFLTLATYPLVVHRGTEAALRAGRTYLWYTITGGAVLFIGVVWLNVLAGPVDFIQTGVLADLPASLRWQLIAAYCVLIGGLGVKAALFPLHGWLPIAMVAPAPVSALLHAVAVVKAGAFGILRVVYDVYGINFSRELGLLRPLAVIAAITIVYGSIKALGQNDLKKRLAYSTVSQLSYIALGAGIFGLWTTIGSLAHLIHQGIMKITLFFCAGNIAETLGLHQISELNGVGRRMPITMTTFTIAALGMIGVPPIAGFVSKWYLGIGGVQQGELWVVLVLLISTGLNALYFLPVVFAAWFKEPPERWEEARPSRFEAPLSLLIPSVITAILSLAAGLFAASRYSPLGISTRIAELIYVK